MLISRFFFLLACPLLLFACAELQERDRNADINAPANWQVAGQHPIEASANWLAEFAEPRLNALVQTALANNFDLKAAAARVQAAREQAMIEGAGRWPQLDFAPGYQRVHQSNAGLSQEEFGAFEALFNFSWELDVWGRIKAAQQAAGQEAEAVAADYRAAHLSLAARTAQIWFALIEARLQAQVAEQSIKDRRTIAELIRSRFNRGLARGLDVRLVLTDLASAEAQLADARNQVQGLQRQLAVLLGHYPDDKLAVAERLPALPSAVPAGLPSELLARRPDVIAAFARLKAADFKVYSAKQALLPRIALTASGGTRSAALADVLDPKAAAWNLAAGLTQPLLTGGRLSGEIRLQQARAEEAVNLYRGTLLTAFREVEQALAAEQWLKEQEQALAEAVAQTVESRKLAVYSYQQGLIQILTLLDSYRSTLDAQSQHLAVQRQLLNNRVNLYLALGGGI